MKLMMVARRYPPDVRSGTETVFENLYLQARVRHQVRLVVGYRDARSKVPPEALAVDLRGANKAESWAKLWLAARREARRFRPDAVLGNSIETPATGAPTACIVHDLNFGGSEKTLSGRAKEAFYRSRSRQLDAIVAVSAAARESLEASGLVGERMHVIHNGVDLTRFRPLEEERVLGEEGVVRFAYPSRILPGKGQHLAIEALARLHKRYKSRAHLTIVGAVNDPIFLDQLKIQAYNQPVDFHTDVPAIAPYYQAADAVLFPTLMEEGFGFTAVEAMACGKPVIWSDQPAVREAVGGIGFPVDRGDVEAMREAMIQLIEDPGLRAEVGEQGRAFVTERYDWINVWGRYEALLEDLVRAARA
jgi:glycosyltransferase involved in cell wall biosynthesis